MKIGETDSGQIIIDELKGRTDCNKKTKLCFKPYLKLQTLNRHSNIHSKHFNIKHSTKLHSQSKFFNHAEKKYCKSIDQQKLKINNACQKNCKSIGHQKLKKHNACHKKYCKSIDIQSLKQIMHVKRSIANLLITKKVLKNQCISKEIQIY